jgi:hypothetical protein
MGAAGFTMPTMEFVTIPSSTYELGWRFTSDLPDDVLAGLRSIMPLNELPRRFSARRRVALTAFEIATTTFPLADLLGDPYELSGIDTIEALCARVDDALAAAELRLPTEDELEAAAGGSLFPWGSEVPEGIPYGALTSFSLHQQPNRYGLRLNSDPYQVELSRHALKFGDGGTSICGGDPWPVAWFALAAAFRLQDDDIADCFVETLEAVRVRPVKHR